MRRRDFVTFLGGAMAWVAAARAQEPRRVIGILSGFLILTRSRAGWRLSIKD